MIWWSPFDTKNAPTVELSVHSLPAAEPGRSCALGQPAKPGPQSSGRYHWGLGDSGERVSGDRGLFGIVMLTATDCRWSRVTSIHLAMAVELCCLCCDCLRCWQAEALTECPDILRTGLPCLGTPRLCLSSSCRSTYSAPCQTTGHERSTRTSRPLVPAATVCRRGLLLWRSLRACHW